MAISNRNGVANLQALVEKRRATTAQARVLASSGKSARAISRQLHISSKHAQSIVTEYRKTLMPVLVNGLVEVGGDTYGSTLGLSQVLGYSDTRIRRVVQDFRINSLSALSKGRVRKAYRFSEVQKALVKSPSYLGRLEPYQFTRAEIKEARNNDLSEEEAKTLLTIIGFMRENFGEAPSYIEIAQLAGLHPYRPKALVPNLVVKGYLTQVKRRIARRVQPQVRYIIRRAPAMAVTHPITCPNCGATIRIKFDWYQPRNGNGTDL